MTQKASFSTQLPPDIALGIRVLAASQGKPISLLLEEMCRERLAQADDINLRTIAKLT